MEQLSIDYARARRDDGIQRAGDHAGNEWKDRARGYVLEFLAGNPEPFLAEDLREFAEVRGLFAPPDGRAWGAVIQSAARDGLIRKVGYAPAKSSNLSPKVQWSAFKPTLEGASSSTAVPANASGRDGALPDGSARAPSTASTRPVHLPNCAPPAATAQGGT